jgi:hypothetical protein
MGQESAGGVGRMRSGWPAAAGLFGVVLATSVFASPGVLIGVPLLLLLATKGFGNVLGGLVAALVILMAAGGRGGLEDVLWYAERGWAVLLGGLFVAFTLALPKWPLTSRALAATSAAAALAGGVLAARGDAWTGIDAAVARIAQSEVDVTVQTLTALGGSGAVTPEMLEVMRNLASARVAVFPALLCLESVAAIGVAWWARARLLGERDRGLSPLRDFRFNDHLVWALLLGLLLVVLQSTLATGRVGSNVLVFMGALYALRGAAVFLFVSGGISVLGMVMLGLLLVLVPPVTLGTAALIGIGDTWLDLRSRTADEAV